MAFSPIRPKDQYGPPITGSERPLFGTAQYVYNSDLYRVDWPSITALVNDHRAYINSEDAGENAIWIETALERMFKYNAGNVIQAYRALVRTLTLTVPPLQRESAKVGQSVSVPRALTGHPQAWMRLRRNINDVKRGSRGTGPVRVVIHHAGAHNQKTLDMRGAMAGALCWALERLGRPTEIVSTQYGRWAHNNEVTMLNWTCVVKPLGRPINWRTMGYMIASSGVETYLYSGGSHALDLGSIGAPGTVPVGSPDDTIHLKSIPLKFASAGQETEESIAITKRWLLDTLEKQGITLEDTK